jgi:hypothetical protein
LFAAGQLKANDEISFGSRDVNSPEERGFLRGRKTERKMNDTFVNRPPARILGRGCCLGPDVFFFSSSSAAYASQAGKCHVQGHVELPTQRKNRGPASRILGGFWTTSLTDFRFVDEHGSWSSTGGSASQQLTTYFFRSAFEVSRC